MIRQIIIRKYSIIKKTVLLPKDLILVCQKSFTQIESALQFLYGYFYVRVVNWLHIYIRIKLNYKKVAPKTRFFALSHLNHQWKDWEMKKPLMFTWYEILNLYAKRLEGERIGVRHLILSV